MNVRWRVAMLLVFLPGLIASPAAASGGSSVPRPSSPSQAPPQKTPEQQAIEHYNAGLKQRDRALDFEKGAGAASDEKDRAKREKKARKAFESAIEEFRMSALKNPRFHQVYSDLGFALRKTGDYEGALEAYNRGLSLDPTYPPAIEYRAEAYLALDRVEESKEAYVQLFTGDRGRADELMAAMKSWIEKRRTDPGKMSPGALEEFSAWVAQREEIARQTPSLSELKNRNW